MGVPTGDGYILIVLTTVPKCPGILGSGTQSQITNCKDFEPSSMPATEMEGPLARKCGGQFYLSIIGNFSESLTRHYPLNSYK